MNIARGEFRILDLTHGVRGPFCTMLLADAGFEVIKIEPPGGERGRSSEPEVAPSGQGAREGLRYAQLNRGKKTETFYGANNPTARPGHERSGGRNRRAQGASVPSRGPPSRHNRQTV